MTEDERVENNSSAKHENVLRLSSSEIRMSVFLHQVWRNASAMEVNGCHQNE